MVRALGVDPGTGSMDILAFEDGSKDVLLFEEAVPRPEVTKDPKIIINLIKNIHKRLGLHAIVAPSGYGIPLKRVQDAGLDEIRRATFIHCEDEKAGLQIVGLRRVMEMLRESDLPAWFTPGGIHLPTIPKHRRANRIDMGTADKVFTVAASMVEEWRRGASPGDINILVIEAGMAYTSVMLVEAGQLTDAMAGTAGFWGFLGGGFMDSELAYALAAVRPRFSKKMLFSGGAASITGIMSPQELEEGLRKGDSNAVEAAIIIVEGIAKSSASLIATAQARPRTVYLSGRLARYPRMRELILRALSRVPGLDSLPVRKPYVLGEKTKEAATGAAIIANGIAGGRYEWVIDSLKIRESSGSVFGNVVDPALRNDLEEYFGSPC